MIFSRHNFYSLRLDKKTENRQDFLRENIAPEHFAMTTQIDFDNQLPRCFARVLLKGETSIIDYPLAAGEQYQTTTPL
jgi:hypothetical protein